MSFHKNESLPALVLAVLVMMLAVVMPMAVTVVVMLTVHFALMAVIRVVVVVVVPRHIATVIAVVGTAMNSGKTTATARLGYGLRRAGRNVALIKATGTGAFGDYNEYCDTGAQYVADFTDAGMATTYLQPMDRLREAADRLLADAGRHGCDVAVMEIADGLFHREPAALLAAHGFAQGLSGLIFACGDAVAASGGASALRRLGITPLAVTGMVSCSPMASAEAEAATGLRVVTRSELADPAQAMRLLRDAQDGRRKKVA